MGQALFLTAKLETSAGATYYFFIENIFDLIACCKIELLKCLILLHEVIG